MAKKNKQAKEEQRRQSRKEVLLLRKQERQTHQIRLVILGIAALLAVVLLVGVVNELFIKPTTPVAMINGEELPMKEWEQRVVLQRAQLVIGLEDLAEAFGQDIGQVQQFAGQQISLLEDPETLGQLVLDQMVDEQLIQQAAVARGIEVSDADVQEEIEDSFSYFGGAAPMSQPTPTETIVPTPSLTPIPTAVITEVLPTNTPFPTIPAGPTSTPPPTATPVSLESFQESFAETMDQFRQFGSDEEEFREVIQAQLLEQRLLEELAIEQELADEAEHISFFFLAFESEEEAQDTLTSIEEGDYLTIWNTIKSLPPGDAADNSAVASEILWRTEDDISNLMGPDLSGEVFDLELNKPSGVLVVPSQNEDGTDGYFIIFVSGKELRLLSEEAIRIAEQEMLTRWLEGQRQSGLEIFERWRSNVPRRPILDRRFLFPPTPGPPTPTIDFPALDATPAVDTPE